MIVRYGRMDIHDGVQQATKEGRLQFAILAHLFQTMLELSFTDHDVCSAATHPE